MGAQDKDAAGGPAPAGGDASAGRKAVSEILGDRYEIVAKLGAGAFGEVYEAKDTSLHRKVAIKRIRLDAFAEGPQLEEVKARFIREAQVAAKLRHPNIVTIHDIAAKGASSFMVMELVEGATLQDLLREKGWLRLEETLRILSQVAAALDYAHGSGVVHRDVKPANLMIEPSGQVKVMDFGIAKAQTSSDVTRAGAIMGTPNYMSPEQARGEKLDGRADLFSLGCVFYECLSGQKPFRGDSVTAILLKIITESPPPIDFDALQLPAPIGAVLERALAKSRGDRYPTGTQMIQAAQEAAAGRATAPTLRTSRVLAAPPAVPPPLPSTAASVAPGPSAPAAAPTPRRAPLPWIIAAALVAAGVGAGLLWTTRASSSGGGGAGSATRVSSHVAREDPGFVGRLLGAKPKLRITVPEGSAFAAQLETPLSSETARPDDAFTAVTSAAFGVDGFEAVPKGSRVKGHVAHAAPSGKVSGRGELTLEFDRIVTPDGKEIPIEAEPLQRKARSTAKKDALKVGAVAGVGAFIGGILGGKKGAAVGGATGGAAGAGVVLATKGEEAVLGEGAPLEIRLRSPFTVTIDQPAK